MCLENLMDAKELAKFKKSLPKEFPIWKCVRENGILEFADMQEPTLHKTGVYKAEHHPKCRIPLCGKYQPGFHGFLKKHIASRYCKDVYYAPGTESVMMPKKFFAKREWITVVGDCYRLRSLVLSHIEVRGRKKKQSSPK